MSRSTISASSSRKSPATRDDVGASRNASPINRPTPVMIDRSVATQEAQRDFHLVAFFEEAAHRLHFYIIVMVVDTGPQLNLLDLDNLLALTGFGGLLLFEKAEFSVVEDFADRRSGIGDDLDEIQSGFFRELERLFRRGWALVLALCINQLHSGNANIAVSAGPLFLRGRSSFHWTANGMSPC